MVLLLNGRTSLSLLRWSEVVMNDTLNSPHHQYQYRTTVTHRVADPTWQQLKRRESDLPRWRFAPPVALRWSANTKSAAAGSAAEHCSKDLRRPRGTRLSPRVHTEINWEKEKHGKASKLKVFCIMDKSMDYFLIFLDVSMENIIQSNMETASKTNHDERVIPFPWHETCPRPKMKRLVWRF